MTARLIVDRKACLKSGQCTYLHPDLFVEGPDGYPVVQVEEVSPDQREGAEEAVEMCPAQAIRLEEDD
jgi:ferredoxin